MYRAYFRFYEELNDFLPEEKRKKRFSHTFSGRSSVKDIIESLGVPHTEVDLILVNGKSVDFSYIVNADDKISVYPIFESFDISEVQHLWPQPLRNPRFVLDVHLGKLASYMRMAGLDVSYRNNFTDEEIIDISVSERRVILTRDLGILKNNKVTHGYYVRNTKVKKQLEEVVERFQLKNQLKLFSRCLKCNCLLAEIDKSEIIDLIPPRVNKYYDEFFICRKCNKIYWKGSHYEKMKHFLDALFDEK